MLNHLRRKSALCLLGLLFFSLSACEQHVTLVPGESDLVVLNGCVVSACNYLAVVKTMHRLEPDFWAKVLLVRFNNHPAGHAYCVWETDGTIYGYDRNSGGFPIPVYTRDARAIAIVLAQELGKILNEPLSVKTAEFVEPNKVELRKFSGLETAEPTAPILAGIADLNTRALSIVGGNSSAPKNQR
jgi:hypothetical protein